MKVALVHDYLREYGGAERVVEALHELYPHAPLYTAFVDWQALGSWGERFRDWDIRTTWVDRNPLVKKWHSPLRFLTPLVWESLDLTGFDVVISSSGWYICRGVITRPETLHISYIHHPPRNLYGFPTGRKPSWLVNAYANMINPYLRMYDFVAAKRVDYLVANSKTTAERIRKFYRRDAEVIYPPVTISNFKFQISNSQIKNRKYFLCVGRLSYAKRIDLAIKACDELKLPLKIVGTGGEENYLRSIAGPTIEFLGGVKDADMAKIYHGAKALIFCGLDEDFGMVPVEAMSYDVPVIALKQGGVTETIVEGKTGVFFEETTVSSLVEAIKKLNKNYNSYKDYKYYKEHVAKFSKQIFMRKMKKFVKDKWRNYYKTLP